MTQTINQYKQSNYQNSLSACPSCSGNGNYQYSEVYLTNLCVCDNGWLGICCDVQQTDSAQLESLQLSVLNEMSQVSMSLTTTSESLPYLNSILSIMSTVSITYSVVSSTMSLISKLIAQDFNAKAPAHVFDPQKMQVAAQIIDICMQYIFRVDCNNELETSRALYDSSIKCLNQLGVLQLWGKAADSKSYTLNTTDFILFSARVPPNNLAGFTIQEPNLPKIVLSGSSSGSLGSEPVDIQAVFWVNNLLACPQTQKADNTPPVVSVAVNTKDSTESSSYSSNVAATISYPVTAGQTYSNCSNSACAPKLNGGYYECSCPKLDSLSSTKTLNIFQKSNLSKLAEAAALLTYQYLSSWVFWILWGLIFWLLITLTCIKGRIVKPLRYTSALPLQLKNKTHHNKNNPSGSQIVRARRTLPENIRNFKLDMNPFKTFIHALKVNNYILLLTRLICNTLVRARFHISLLLRRRYVPKSPSSNTPICQNSHFDGFIVNIQ